MGGEGLDFRQAGDFTVALTHSTNPHDLLNSPFSFTTQFFNFIDYN